MDQLDTGKRNARVLAFCQALFICAISVDLTLTGITGYQLAPDKILATLPFALITVGAAVVTVFAAFVMERLGRRLGFALGALCGGAGGLVSVWSIVHGDFWLFCLGTAGVGAFQGFAQFYAIAAADSVHADYKSRAISTVLAGGVIAAVIGPLLASRAKDLFFDTAFAGAYLLVAVLAMLSAIGLLLFYRDIGMIDAQKTGDILPARPLREIARQPIFVAGVATTMVASAAMMFVMTASPLAAVACGFSIEDGASVIQWHLFGMFAPSFFAGRLVARFGVIRVFSTGIALMAACVVIATSSTALPAFHLALLALGIGWNMLIVCGTTLLSRSYRASERGKTQALSGLLGNLAATFSTLSAGAALQGLGWSTLNLLILPMLAVCLLLVLRWKGANRATLGEGIA
ncbi:MFS transporter [Rhizobium grahamii]|uniref:MFS transporter n=1 Tax=Rhizobium grahamii TaxID=1120045 RepID=A0A5Q0CDV9_9HYPH|nr:MULTISPECIES: MFS transporter [Rhizobium]QFY62121.1 MFS transporter [Rhizobium grahamii]QRM48696.1 MFS transporter [Rhizobium sp. BG6]